MKNLNIDQLRQDLCKQLAIIGMIDKAVTRKRLIVIGMKLDYYSFYDNDLEKAQDLEKINQLIDRLVNYLANLSGKEVSHA